jgi:hypothetical protein
MDNIRINVDCFVQNKWQATIRRRMILWWTISLVYKFAWHFSCSNELVLWECWANLMKIIGGNNMNASLHQHCGWTCSSIVDKKIFFPPAKSRKMLCAAHKFSLLYIYSHCWYTYEVLICYLFDLKQVSSVAAKVLLARSPTPPIRKKARGRNNVASGSVSTNIMVFRCSNVVRYIFYLCLYGWALFIHLSFVSFWSPPSLYVNCAFAISTRFT